MAHFDIKKDNILYSPTFNKAVFIDYGLTEFIYEDIGNKSLTNFKGTISYCCD